MRNFLKDHAEWLWAPLLYSIAVAYLYSELLSGNHGFGWDTIESYWPDLVYFTDSVRAGQWPLWNPYDRGGYPYAADPQPGLYYPIQWLLAGIGAIVGGASWWLIQLKMLLHHVIAGLCLHAFLRHRGLPKLAATVGGIALIASTPWLIHKASNLLAPMVWAPLIWIATDRLLASPTWSRAAALAGSIYLAGSAGSPPGFFYTLLMASLYGAFRGTSSLWEHWKSHSLRSYAPALLVRLFAAALLVLGLLWVNISPALQLSEHTPRVEHDLAYVLSLPLPMLPTLKALLIPTAGQLDAYCGILVLLLGGAALVLSRRQDKGAPMFFAAAALFFLALSFAADLPLLSWLASHVPGFDLFRISSRYKCLFAPMMASLAAYGVAALIAMSSGLHRETWKLIGLCAFVSALGLYLAIANPIDPSLVHRLPPISTPLTWMFVAAAVLVASAWHQPRARTLLVTLLPMLVLLDPERYWHHQQSFVEAKVDHTQDEALIQSLAGVPNHQYRIYDEFVLEQRAGSRLRVRDFRGYPSGDPLDFRRYQEVLKKSGENPELLEAFNVRYILHASHHRNSKRTHRLKRDPSRTSPAHFRLMKAGVREALHPVPLVQFYAAALVKPKEEVLDALLKAENAQGQRTHLILEPEARDALQPALMSLLESNLDRQIPALSGQLLRFETDMVSIRVQAPSTGLVVLNEVNYPGWKVRVDGKEEIGTTANYLLRAVPVSKGDHQIEWYYEPPGHRLRLRAYQLSLLLLLLPLFMRARRYKTLLR